MRRSAAPRLGSAAVYAPQAARLAWHRRRVTAVDACRAARRAARLPRAVQRRDRAVFRRGVLRAVAGWVAPAPSGSRTVDGAGVRARRPSVSDLRDRARRTVGHGAAAQL